MKPLSRVSRSRWLEIVIPSTSRCTQTLKRSTRPLVCGVYGLVLRGSTGLWTRGLLIRRSLSDQGLAFFSTWCPAGTPIETLVRVEGQRWAIEDAFETAKTELGLAHNETRSWHGWHRHVSLVMLAFAMMAVVRQHANRLALTPKKKRRGRAARWYAGRSRRSDAWRCACQQRRIQPAYVIAWSVWRRAHQAAANLTSQTKGATVVLL